MPRQASLIFFLSHAIVFHFSLLFFLGDAIHSIVHSILILFDSIPVVLIVVVVVVGTVVHEKRREEKRREAWKLEEQVNLTQLKQHNLLTREQTRSCL